ncbi:MAG: putative molybdenum carrier protein [Desulfobacterales bacterium]|jgi:hypothetical protein
MIVTKIISSGAFGAESAALDVAIRLKIPYEGYTGEHSMLNWSRVFKRYKNLWEQSFDSLQHILEANLNISNGTLVFTRGAPNEDLSWLIQYAEKYDHPCLHINFDKTTPLQAIFKINVWCKRDLISKLHVAGSVDDEGIYGAVSECMNSALMLGREAYPILAKPPAVKKPIPRTVKEAVEHLMDKLPLKDKVKIANMSASEIGELNHTLGNYIRNKFDLWSGNDKLLWSCAREAGSKIQHPDQASSVIISRLALELEKSHKLRSI